MKNGENLVYKEKPYYEKLLAILFLIIAVQGIAETVVKGTYETKRKRYVELTQTLEKEIFLNYTLPDNKKEIVTYKGKDFDILVNKNDLLELYNRRRVDKIDDIKNKISYKDEKFEYFRNYFSELIENNKAVVYDKNEKEINYLIKVKYDNAIFMIMEEVHFTTDIISMLIKNGQS